MGTSIKDDYTIETYEFAVCQKCGASMRWVVNPSAPAWVCPNPECGLVLFRDEVEGKRRIKHTAFKDARKAKR